MSPSPEDAFQARLEEIFGVSLPDDPLARADVAAALGLDPADAATWSELHRRLDDVQRFMETLPDADSIDWLPPVEQAFQATIERLGDDAFEPAVLARQPPGVRLLMSTRAVEGAVNDGGWPSVFSNEMDVHIAGAIAGYRSLGLDEHAALAERAREHGFDLESDDDAWWRALDAEWFRLPDPELARTEYLRAHPDAFDVTSSK